MPALKSLLRFLRRLRDHRSIVWTMARWDIQARYAGTLAGLIWSVVHPLMLILIYWFVFSVGFKVGKGDEVPFIIVFLCGLIPWTTFAETLSACTTAITGSPHLVKKIVFPTEILPVVHLTASMISQAIMLAILLVLMAVHGLPFSLYNFQFIYFLFSLSMFCIGLGWLVSALNVFFRDVGHILAVLLNMWFWLTPIVWKPEMLGRYRPFLKFNPMYYIVQGYRSSFLPTHYAGFWHDWRFGAYFWVVTLAMLAFGGLVFKKLKPDFPEVL